MTDDDAVVVDWETGVMPVEIDGMEYPAALVTVYRHQRLTIRGEPIDRD